MEKQAPLFTSASQVSSRGHIAARAFKLFAESVPLTQVVIELEIPGEEVAALFETWWKLNRATQDWLHPGSPPESPPAAPTTPAPPPLPEDEAPEVYVKPRRGPKPYEAPDRSPPEPPASPNMCDAPQADGMCCPTHYLQKRRTANGAH